MKYGNKKKKMGAGGVSGSRKKMRAGGVPGSRLGKVGRKPIPKNVPGGGGIDYGGGEGPALPIGRRVPPKQPIGPKVPMKMDSEGRRGMKHGGTTGSAPGVVSYQDYVKKTFG